MSSPQHLSFHIPFSASVQEALEYKGLNTEGLSQVQNTSMTETGHMDSENSVLPIFDRITFRVTLCLSFSTINFVIKWLTDVQNCLFAVLFQRSYLYFLKLDM